MRRMSPDKRRSLQARWFAIEQELNDLLDGKVAIGSDPATREAELREEQDEIEFELASDHLDCGMSE